VEERLTWKAVAVVGEVSSRIAKSLLSSGTMEWIDSGKSLDEGFSLIGNRVPVRTLEFDSGVSNSLGEGCCVVGTKRGVAAEANVGDDSCTERAMSLYFVCVWRTNTCGPDVHRFSVAGVFDDFACDVAERPGERGELLVGGVKEYSSVKR